MAKFEIIAFVLVCILATAATGAPPPNPSAPPPPPPQPTPTLPADCMGTLSQLLSCVPFLSGRAGAPPADCCRPFRDIVQRPERVCLCHALSGALSRFISTPISSIRLALLPLHCATLIPPSLLVNCVGKNYGFLIRLDLFCRLLFLSTPKFWLYFRSRCNGNGEPPCSKKKWVLTTVFQRFFVTRFLRFLQWAQFHR